MASSVYSYLKHEISSSSILKPDDISSENLGRQGALNSSTPISPTSIAATSANATPTLTSPSSSSTTTSQMAGNGFPTSATGNRRRVDPLDIPEDDPPAYTPRPDVHHGEATVEHGPGRPFQPPPQRPSFAQPRPPQHPGWSAIQNNVVHPSPPTTLLQQITGTLVDRLNNLSTGGNTYNYNRYQYPGNFAPSPRPSGYPPPPGPPPGHLPQQNTGPAQQYYPPPPHPPPTSDFARDFYQVGSGPNPQSSQGDTAATTASTPGPGSAAGPSSGQANVPPALANDNRPTQTPAPGHPLLNDGKLLVYPPGFLCRKCNNIGYKKADPKRPCKRCWSKYAKPFTGALSYSDFSPNASTGSGTSFQKPLPMRNPAKHAGPGPGNGYPGAAAHYQQNHPPPISPDTSFGPYRPPPQHHPSVVVAGPGFRPPGSIVYKPGDTRIGGQLCWKCDGDGLVDMLFWEDRCDVCGGTGRTFR